MIAENNQAPKIQLGEMSLLDFSQRMCELLLYETTVPLFDFQAAGHLQCSILSVEDANIEASLGRPAFYQPPISY